MNPDGRYVPPFNLKSYPMTSSSSLSNDKKPKDRKQREAEALRANLQRRKEQSRARLNIPDTSPPASSLHS